MQKLLLSLVILIASLAIPSAAQAQDTIVLKNRKVIIGYVKEISNTTLTYVKKTSDRHVYKLDLIDVYKITYENGETEKFDERFARVRPDGSRVIPRNGRDKILKPGEEYKPTSPDDYKNNIVSFFPMQVSNHGMGIGIKYERVLDKKGYFSFDLPVSWSYMAPANTYFRAYTSNKPSVVGLYPNFKFYPTTSRGPNRYGIGIGIAYEWGNRKVEESTYSNFGFTQFVERNIAVKRFGIMLTHSVNTFPSPHIAIGLEGSFGYLIAADDEYRNNLGFGNQNIPMLRLGLRFGYRFGK